MTIFTSGALVLLKALFSSFFLGNGGFSFSPGVQSGHPSGFCKTRFLPPDFDF